MAEPVRKMPADRETQADPFRYGWRWQRVRLPNGEVTEQQIPLTPEDLLNPQLGDEVPQSLPHFRLVTLLADLLTRHFEPWPDVLVTGDFKMFWGIPGLKEPAPDVVVIPGVRDKDAKRASFDVVAEGTRPSLVIEVVSPPDPEIRRNDYERKVEIYQRVGIPDYLIYEPPTRENDRLTLIGYHLGPDGRYRRIKPEAQGLLLAPAVGLLFGVDEDGQTPVVVEPTAARRLLTSHQEEKARKAAERRVAEEAKARKVAERRAADEAEARKAAEDEVARLRAELEKLRNPSRT
jgi:Uma2 family endonuclease